MKSYEITVKGTKSIPLISNLTVSISGLNRKCVLELPVHQNAIGTTLYAPSNDREKDILKLCYNINDRFQGCLSV